MSLITNDSFVEVSLKEVSKESCYFDVLEKVRDHLQITLVNPGATAGVGILRSSLVDTPVGAYFIQENGAGITIGLFKNVDGIPIQIKLPLPGEITIIKNQSNGAFVPPKGWILVTDTEAQSKYNVGASPNWKFAAVQYVGI